MCSIEDLCDRLPTQYTTLLSYLKTLPFNAKPNYSYLSGLIGKLRLHDRDHLVFDWDFEQCLTHNHLNIPHTKSFLPIMHPVYTDHWLNLFSVQGECIVYHFMLITNVFHRLHSHVCSKKTMS